MSVIGTDPDRIVLQLVKVKELLNHLALTADLNGHETSRNVPHPVLVLGPRGTEAVPGVTDTRFIPEVPQVHSVQTLSSTLSPGLLQNTIPSAAHSLLSLSEMPGKGASDIRTEVRSQFVSSDVSNSDECSTSDNESTESRRSYSAVRSDGTTKVGAPLCGLYCKDVHAVSNILV